MWNKVKVSNFQKQSEQNLPLSLIDRSYMYYTITPIEVLPLVHDTIVMENHHSKVTRKKL